MHREEGVVGADKRGWINIYERKISGSALIDET